MLESICLGMRLRPMQADKSKRKTQKECVPITVTANIATTASPWRNRLIIDAEEKEASERNMGENDKKSKRRKWGEGNKPCVDTTGNSYLRRFRPRLRLRRSFLWLSLAAGVFWFPFPFTHSLIQSLSFSLLLILLSK